MPHTTDTRAHLAQPNIQDAFLNFARRERLVVTIRLMDGQEIGSPRSAGNYLSSQG